MTDQAPDTDVLVVGAGPTGLLLAAELARAGVDCTLVERRGQTSNLTRAFAVHARTLELLDARGLADELLAAGRRVDAVRLYGTVRVHLGGLPTAFPYVLVTPQYETERVLRQRAESLEVTTLRGTEVTALRQDADGVDVELRGGDGARRTVRASYVVGADGAHSTVRSELGAPFAGRPTPMRSVILADARLADPPENLFTVNGTGDDFAFIAPFGDGWYRLIAWNRRHQPPRDTPADLEEVRQITKRALGRDFGMHDARWLSRFGSEERQVPHYRQGRVFLAGDAAHIHSPAGALGMNTGLQDAFNLGWKLAAVVRGQLPDALLDSYHTERHPVGRTAIRLSATLLRLVLLRPAPLRALRGALAGAAMRIGPLVNRVAGGVSGILVRYPAPRGAHPLVGNRAPDLALSGDDGPARLYEALRPGRFVLLTPAAGRPVPAGWSARVDGHRTADSGRPWQLVRPDGYVAWASDESDPARRGPELAEVLTRWCGPADAQTDTGRAA